MLLYEWIFDSLNSSLLLNKVVAIFAFVTQKIELRDIAKLCEEDEVAVGDCLYHLYPLLQEDVNGFYVFHNDVRLYFKDRCKQNRNCANIVQRFESIILNEKLSQLVLEHYDYPSAFISEDNWFMLDKPLIDWREIPNLLDEKFKLR